MMKYKGYTGEAFYDDEIKKFSGRIANSKAVGTFYFRLSSGLIPSHWATTWVSLQGN